MKIRSSKLHEMLLSAANLLETEKEQINGLNVFPVPDGDTGSNMSMTMSGVREVSLSGGEGAGDLAAAAAGKMLRSARGNSGVILSLFFKGFAKALAYLDEITVDDLAAAFRAGCESAYRSVMNPTEGTILTVMRRCADRAVALTSSCGDAADGSRMEPAPFFAALLEEAKDALAETPELLPVLKSAGVVDAGGRGFVSVLDGMLAALEGRPYPPPEEKAEVKDKADFSRFATEDITFPYCTECIVNKSARYRGEGSADDLRAFLSGIGDSLVFVDDEEIIKLHVHTDDPGRVLSRAISYGDLATVKVENMRLQHTELRDAELLRAAKEQEEAELRATRKPYGFVTVAAGEGIAAALRDLGADAVVEGGQTMNPSMEDILTAIGETNAEVVYVLPGNGNIILAAKQAAAEVRGKSVLVLPAKSIPETIVAMLAFDEEKGADSNFSRMREAMARVRSLSVTYAAHNSVLDGREIHEGEILGLVDGEVTVIAESREQCLREFAPLLADAEFLTVFWGEDVTPEEAQNAADLLRSLAPRAELTVLPGNQPVYAYLISVE